MAGWERLLAELVESRGSELNRYGFLLSGDRSEAADLVQEALVRVFARPRRSWELADIERYVRRTMLNRFLDIHRRRQRYALLAPRLAESSVSTDHSGAITERLELLSALGSLSPRQRACVVLRYYEDLPVASVADRLDCSEGTVKRHLSDALVRLAAALQTAHRDPEQGVGA
ncbi:SigE family RNA polymerase sigma factor [Kitasatospora putterlickiae]|uniref:SigE family RNA polymerase sigma factor n=1 Tax=Kitasatospora putterlickiae TaxID=221725 RepID=A0ABP4IAC5_9ACTN